MKIRKCHNLFLVDIYCNFNKHNSLKSMIFIFNPYFSGLYIAMSRLEAEVVFGPVSQSFFSG